MLAVLPIRPIATTTPSVAGEKMGGTFLIGLLLSPRLHRLSLKKWVEPFGLIIKNCVCALFSLFDLLPPQLHQSQVKKWLAPFGRCGWHLLEILDDERHNSWDAINRQVFDSPKVPSTFSMCKKLCKLAIFYMLPIIPTIPTVASEKVGGTFWMQVKKVGGTFWMMLQNLRMFANLSIYIISPTMALGQMKKWMAPFGRTQSGCASGSRGE